MIRFAALAVLIAVPFDAAAQAPTWRHLHTVDELSGREDDRLLLRSDDVPELERNDSPDQYQGSALLVLCGNRVPNDSGRALLFFAGEPLMPFGNGEEAFAEIRFDAGKSRGQYLPILDWGDAIVIETAHPSARRTAYFGEDRRPYYSETFLRKMLAAKALSVDFRSFDEHRRVTFHVEGLATLLAQLPACRWPQ